MAARRHRRVGAVLSYFSELTEAMRLLGEHGNTVFLGQGVGNPGTSMSDSFAQVPKHKLLEMPVAEELQMGMAIGMAMSDLLPVCVFPRWNFMLCAANQIVNHLDRIELISGYRTKVIIRVATPSVSPFNPGPQHDDDLGDAFSAMLRTISIVRLKHEHQIVPAYKAALDRPDSVIMVEYTDLYKNERGNVSR